jgi:hypothetical protein
MTNIAISDYNTGTLHLYMGVEFDTASQDMEAFVLDKGFSLNDVEWFCFTKIEGVSE